MREVELRLAKGGKEARLIVAQGLGVVDLMALQNGVTLALANVQIPVGAEVTQIRMILNVTGNRITNLQDETYDLRIPSEAHTGIKILIHGSVAIERGYDYSIVADFDAKKSVVQMGNGSCLLKPVLKLKSAARLVVPQPADDRGGAGAGGSEMGSGSSSGTSEDIPVTGDNSGDSSGFEDGTEASPPPIVEAASLSDFLE